MKNDRDAETRPDFQTIDGAKSGKGHARHSGAPRGEVGGALRSIYQRTIEEAIPPEMLDLLGKLD